MNRRDFIEIVVSDYEKVMTLSKSTLCCGMDRTEAQLISSLFQTYQVNNGSKIYDEGDNEAFMCLIITGEVQIIKCTDKIISTLKAGEIVGEMSIIDELPRSASAVACVPSVLYAITRNRLNELFAKSPLLWSKMIYNISVSMSYRLRQTNDMLAQLIPASDSLSTESQKNFYPPFHPFFKKINS